MGTSPKNIDSILCEAVEIESAAQREAFLDEACGKDSELRRRLDKLIGDHFRAGDFLEDPPSAFCATIDQPIREKPGAQVGPYKLLQQIGEGGFGVVYMAEQHKPVRRKVALKIVKPGMDTKEVIARFEAERQALALMDHPNIAKVFDAGATETGRPYFVMELVRGIPLIEFCDENNLNTQQRLRLFVAVCRAIQHAHQKGIIHRDLKPSNVMVTLHDNKPVPKVIDFGVSKAISQQLTEKTLFTAYGQMVGTPTYMSPEQAQMSGLDVDTRSDIYSLGVMLFELLTGSTPLDAEQLRKSGYEEMQRLIREEEAPRPSLRLSSRSGEARARIARNRGTDAGQLETQLRGELDWIVIKALEKDRNRRYETANGFAADVERHLNDEPVRACPPSLAYRTRKFIHRNRGPVLVAGTLVVAVFLGVVGLSIGYVRATRSEETARQASREALADKNRAEEAMKQERRARLDAIAAGKLKDESLTDVYTTLGLAAGEQRRTPEATLLFVNAAQLAPDEMRARYNRIRARSWRNDMLALTAVLPHPAEWIADMQVYANGEYVMTRVFGPHQDRDTVDLGAISIWDVTNATTISMPAQLTSPRAARWSPDGSWLAVIDSDGELFEVAFPSLQTGRKLATDCKAQLLRFSPSGRYLGMFGSHEARVWDCRQRNYVTPPLAHPDFVAHLRFSSEEDHIVTSSVDDRARVFAVPQDSSEPLFEPVAHHVTLDRRISVSLRDAAIFLGKRLLTNSRRSRLSGELVCRDALSGDVISRWRGSGFDGATDGARYVVSMSLAGSGVLVDTDSLEAQRLGVEHHGIPAINSSSNRLALAGPGFLRLFGVPDLKEIAASVAISRSPNQVQFSPDGSCLVTAERGGLVKVWRHIERNPGSYQLHCGASFADVSKDGKYFLPIGLSQRSSRLQVTRVYEVETGRPAADLIRPGGTLLDGKFSPDGDRLALATSLASGSSRFTLPGSQAGELSIWDWRKGARISAFSLKVEPRCLDFSPDGRRIAVLSADGAVFVLDAATGEPTLPPWSAHPPYLQNNWYINNGEIAYSPDGSCIITWGAPDYARFWNADSGQLRYELNPDWRVLDLAFSPDGKRFATSEWGADRVQVWDFESGQRVGAAMEHPDWPMKVCFSGDGTRIVSGCRDRAARVWDWRTGKLVCPPMRHPHEVHAVAFLAGPDGQLVLTCCDNKTARVWECLTGKPVTPPIPIQSYGLTISLTPNGSHAVIGGNSSTGLDVLCLEEILADDDRQSPADLMAMAEFYSGHRLVKGGLKRLSDREAIETYAKAQGQIQSEASRRGYDAPQVATLVSNSVRPSSFSLADVVDRMFDRLDNNSDGLLDERDETGLGPPIWQRLLRDVTQPLDRGQFKAHCVRSIFDSVDEDSDGKILRSEASAADLGGTFDEMDVDRDESITLGELERGVDRYSLSPRLFFQSVSAPAPPKNQSLTEKFAEHDVDGDGAVTKGEAGEGYWNTIGRFDVGGDGAVDREEHDAGLRDESLAKRRRLFLRADREPIDGQLSPDEAGGLWKKYESFDSNGDNLLNEHEFLKATAPNGDDRSSEK